MAGGAVLTTREGSPTGQGLATGHGPTAGLDLVPHFRQIGAAPVFVGDGANDLICRCGDSTLVRGNRPGALLAIGIECAACGTITTTPGLPGDQVLPIGVRVAERNRMEVSEPLVLAPGMVLADRDELVRVERLSTPRAVPAQPFVMSAATLAEVAADYDRLSGGQLEAHRRAVANPVAGPGSLPLAWALRQLEASVDKPGWWCLAEEPDAVAAILVGAFREFLLAWSQHPLFPAMAAAVAQTGFSSHALAVFAAARCMAEDGNRVGFTLPGGNQTGTAPPGGDGQINTFHIETAPTQRLRVVVRRFDRFDWPGGSGATQATARAAWIDTLIASQGQINARQPGLLVASMGASRRTIDAPVFGALEQVMRERGRRHRALAGVALIRPGIIATDHSDHVAFGWTFVPFGNPHYAHGTLQTGTSGDTPGQAPTSTQAPASTQTPATG